MQAADPADNKRYVLISISLMVFVIAIINIIAYYAGNETIDVNTLHTFNNRVLSGTPEKYQMEESGTYYYLFKFAGGRKRHFSLEEKYYNYGKPGHSLRSLKAGDTLSVQLAPIAMQCYDDIYEDHIVEMVNYSRKNIAFIDLSRRNQLIIADNRKNMYIWCGAVGLAAIACTFLFLQIYRRNRRLNVT